MKKFIPRDSACRIFLNLLNKNNKMSNVPFLYFSAHDPHSHHIFLGLKYGSIASSSASSMQVCSKIQWAGRSDVPSSMMEFAIQRIS